LKDTKFSHILTKTNYRHETTREESEYLITLFYAFLTGQDDPIPDSHQGPSVVGR